MAGRGGAGSGAPWVRPTSVEILAGPADLELRYIPGSYAGGGARPLPDGARCEAELGAEIEIEAGSPAPFTLHLAQLP